MKNLIIVGAGGYAKSVLDSLDHMNFRMMDAECAGLRAKRPEPPLFDGENAVCNKTLRLRGGENK